MIVKEDRGGNEESDEEDEGKQRENELTSDIDSQVRRLMEKGV